MFSFGSKFKVVTLNRKTAAANRHRTYMDETLTTNTRLEEPIDVVYTWVNGSDPKFIESLQSLPNEIKRGEFTFSKDMRLSRYAENGYLKYSLRSLLLYADWVRHIFIVTNGQVPYWLNLDNPKVSIVTHSEIFLNKSNLPTFNSIAIEMNLHRIPGLSRRFIYLNDDVFFGKEITLDEFYTTDKVFKIYKGWGIGACSKECQSFMINNGICELQCNTGTCYWDGDDCIRTNGYLKDPKIVDAYGSQLTQSVALLSKLFGPTKWLTPAHVQMFLDKDAITELEKWIPFQWNKASSQKIRDGDSIQFGTVYRGFLLSVKDIPSPSDIFDKADTDGSGDLTSEEIVNVILTMPNSSMNSSAIINAIRHCNANIFTMLSGVKTIFPIMKTTFTKCLEVVRLIHQFVPWPNRYKHIELEATNADVYYVGINVNSENVQLSLDQIRQNKPKFFCLNDEGDYTDPYILDSIKTTLDFLNSTYPLPSSLEKT